MKKLLLIFTPVLVLIACNPLPKQSENSVSTEHITLAKHPKNIVLLIGDGMGITQVTAALYANNNQLNLEQFQIVGLHKPYASNDLITDSAAGATAFASGIKTYNGAIGVNDEKQPVPTILEEAEARGLATGLIATSSITHATPAAFIAHVEQRKMMEGIAAFFLSTEIDLFIGGGKKYFDRRETDARNLIRELEEKNYKISDYTKEELPLVAIDFSKNFGYFTADAEPLPRSQGRDYLVPAAKLAPLFLEKRSDKGFFLMIESAQIDWGGHANDSDYIISETIEFDYAIGAILEYAKENGETLVIVTADHETGGYAINTGSRMGRIDGAFTTDYHTGALIPVFAYGPGAELFAGTYENTDLYHKMRQALQFKGEPKVSAFARNFNK